LRAWTAPNAFETLRSESAMGLTGLGVDIVCSSTDSS